MEIELVESESVAVERASDAAGRAGEIFSQAQQMVVTAENFSDASRFLANIKTLGKQIETERKALTDPLRAVIDRIMGKFRPATDALAAAESIVKGKLAAHAEEIERRRRAAEAAAREKQCKEEDRLAKLAAKAAARGDDAKAEAFTAKAEQVALAPVSLDEFDVPAAEGLSFVTTYSAEVTDLKALCTAVLSGAVPEMAIMADSKYLNATARATKGAMKWPGVKWIATKTARQRT